MLLLHPPFLKDDEVSWGRADWGTGVGILRKEVQVSVELRVGSEAAGWFCEGADAE